MDKRYEDETIAMIYRTWRNRQNMVRADGKLVLQIKAICRGFADGDIKEANKLFSALRKGEGSLDLATATEPFFQARLPLEESRKSFEKWLTDHQKLGRCVDHRKRAPCRNHQNNSSAGL